VNRAGPRNLAIDQLLLLEPTDDPADIVVILTEFLSKIEEPAVARAAAVALERIYGK